MHSMRERIRAVVEELKRRKADGETMVYVGDGTIETLREKALSSCRGDSDKGMGMPVKDEKVLPKIRRPVVVASSSVPVSKSRIREKAPSAERKLPTPPEFSIPEGDKHMRWEWLREKVLNCPVCNANLNPGRKVVFGNGSIDSPIFFCGEAPGADEELQGIPFVGRAGQLLIKIIKAMGLERENVYIGNIMNWRPQTGSLVGNRPPTEEEMAFCLPYLRAQVEIVRPKVIVALGNTALKGLLGAQAPGITRARGKWFDFGGTPLMPTYHPSYVLRYGSPKTKREIWEDMLAVMEKVGMKISDRQRGYFLPKT